MTASGMGPIPDASAASTRTLSLYHTHTRESLTITYKRDGKFDAEALRKLNRFLRDWRNDEQVRMDPKLFDILWEVNREVGGREPIQIVSSYRSPKTNAALRARSSGVAENSQHILGKAIDFRIPNVNAARLRVAGLRLQRGGVGYYASSNFVHLDTGNVRHWPRMTRQQLAQVFPDGRTVHIPSDGKPLPGYQLALADVRRNTSSSSVTEETTASGSGLFARIFGGGRDQGDDSDTRVRTASSSSRPAPTATSTPAESAPVVAQAPIPAPRPVSLIEITPETPETPGAPVQLAAAMPVPRPAGPQMVWQNGPQPVENTPLAASSEAVAAIASVAPALPAPRPDQARTEPLPETLVAYAPATIPMPAAPQRASLGLSLPGQRSASETATVATPRPVTPLSSMTAAIPAPSTTTPVLTTGQTTPETLASAPAAQLASLRYPEPRAAGELLFKPARVVALGFGGDPAAGMSAGAFRGRAVAYIQTVRVDTPPPPARTLSARLH